MKKCALSIAVVLVLAAAAVGGVWLYRMFQPELHVFRAVRESDARFPGEEYHYERIQVTIAIRENVPMPDALSNVVRDLADWCNEVDTDLTEHYAAPLHISVDGKTEGGTTTFWYTGYAATPDGETVDYYQEASFPFAFGSDGNPFTA